MDFRTAYLKCFNAITDSIIYHKKEVDRLEDLQKKLEEKYMNEPDTPIEISSDE